MRYNNITDADDDDKVLLLLLMAMLSLQWLSVTYGVIPIRCPKHVRTGVVTTSVGMHLQSFVRPVAQTTIAQFTCEYFELGVCMCASMALPLPRGRKQAVRPTRSVAPEEDRPLGREHIYTPFGQRICG